MRDSQRFTALEMLAIAWVAYIVGMILFGIYASEFAPMPAQHKPSPYIRHTDTKPRSLSEWKFCNPDYEYLDGEEILVSKCPSVPQRYTDIRRVAKRI